METGKTEINYCRNENLGGSLYPEGTEFDKRILSNIDDDEEFYKKLKERTEKIRKRNSHYQKVKPEDKRVIKKRGNRYEIVPKNLSMTTKGRKLEITNYVLNLILQGKPKGEIVEQTGDKYQMTEPGVSKYITLANKAIVSQSEEERKMIKEKNHALLLDLYNKNIMREDYREARAIIEVMNKMYGLNEADKLELSGNIIRFNFDVSNDLKKQTKLKRKIILMIFLLMI